MKKKKMIEEEMKNKISQLVRLKTLIARINQKWRSTFIL